MAAYPQRVYAVHFHKPDKERMGGHRGEVPSQLLCYPLNDSLVLIRTSLLTDMLAAQLDLIGDAR